MTSILCKKNQRKVFGPRAFRSYGEHVMLTAIVEYGDDCGNGHNTFSVTADLRERGRDIGGGCMHDAIAEVFPELAPFIKWHLVSSDGPMHYIANTLYLAGKRDCWGKLKGEPKSYETKIRFGDNPILHTLPRKFVAFLKDAAPYDFEVIAIEHENKTIEAYPFKPKYTFGGYADKWHECPFDSEQEALNFLTALQTCKPEFVTTPVSFGEGKARELDAARSAACWPEATDEELTAPDLKEKLEARLPQLLADFQTAVESFGFAY